ncbi:MAG TPA: isocitrate/isopropylmalate family dehydrogenase, partial [Thermoanaerobaculia bacterium]|nr:isocitrate/isopropylmalate family dehydrogenase [Thermoanaerobaculia bacterium]
MNPVHPKDRRPQRIAVLPGDGTGKDVTAEAVKVLESAAEAWDLPLELVHLDWDADRYLATGETMPAGALDDFRQNYSAIFIGAYGDPRVPDMKHAADILLGIRFGLDLYINLRPIKLYDPRMCPLKDRTEKDVDMVIFRENTEGAY